MMGKFCYRVGVAGALAFLLLMIRSSNVYARCWMTYNFGLICGASPSEENCSSTSSTSAIGTAVYSCASNYLDCYDETGGQGCYKHEYACDTACGSTGSGGGGGGTGDWCSSNSDCGSGCCNTNKNYCTNCSGFICPADPVACPPGTTRSATVTGTQCLNPNCTTGSYATAEKYGKITASVMELACALAFL